MRKEESASLILSSFHFGCLPTPLDYGTQRALAFDKSWKETIVPPVISGQTWAGDNRGLQGTFPALPLLLLLVVEPL